MWDRIFLLSMVVFFVGMLAVLAGEFVVPGWSPVTSVVGGSIAGFGGQRRDRCGSIRPGSGTGSGC